jgi:hypothetical protein
MRKLFPLMVFIISALAVLLPVCGRSFVFVFAHASQREFALMSFEGGLTKFAETLVINFFLK